MHSHTWGDILLSQVIHYSSWLLAYQAVPNAFQMSMLQKWTYSCTVTVNLLHCHSFSSLSWVWLHEVCRSTVLLLNIVWYLHRVSKRGEMCDWQNKSASLPLLFLNVRGLNLDVNDHLHALLLSDLSSIHDMSLFLPLSIQFLNVKARGQRLGTCTTSTHTELWSSGYYMWWRT